MMTESASCPVPPTAGASPAAICSQKPEQRGLPISVVRMQGLETAAKMLGGKEALAGHLGLTTRALSYKIGAERGISDLDLTMTAAALEAHADRLTDHARKLRDEAVQRGGQGA